MTESRIIKFSNEFATAELFLVSPNTARLRSVYSRNRGRGHASQLLREVMAYADRHHLNLYLVVQRYGKPAKGMSNDQLESFYTKFGFRKMKHPGKFTMMYRKRAQKLQGL